MKPAFLAFLGALFISGCGMDGPPPQEAKEPAKAAATPASKPNPAAPGKNTARTQSQGSTPTNGESISPEGSQPTPTSASSNRAGAATVEPEPRTAGGDRKAPRVLVDQAENTAAGIPWTKDVVLTQPGVVDFHVTSQGRFAVTIVTDKAYQAFQRSDEKAFTNKKDVLYMAESQGFEMNGKIKLPAGTWWFLIENRSDAAVDFHLKCYLLDK